MGVGKSIQASMLAVQEQAGAKMIENMRKVQEEQRAHMAKTQREQMSRMKSVEMALARARARENSKWTGGLLTFVVTAAGISKAKHGSVPPMMAVPIVLLTVGTSYLVDMGWGHKVERIQRDARSILEEEGKGDYMP